MFDGIKSSPPDPHISAIARADTMRRSLPLAKEMVSRICFTHCGHSVLFVSAGVRTERGEYPVFEIKLACGETENTDAVSSVIRDAFYAVFLSKPSITIYRREPK